ncbi:MAG TPA: biopolymer transporter ExbD [Bdellovibrionota bacterium]|nr:biopolymer transporter ExbD [Bdellovibrionota bacterium]
MPSNLNLVPFIDLFSTMIIFLIITAVFDQLAAVQINMGAEDKPADAVPATPIKKIEASLKVTIHEDSIELFDAGQREVINKQDGEYDFAPVRAFAEAAREKYPEKKDVVVFSDDKAKYKDLVSVMDEFLGESFTEVVVTGGGGK